MADKDWLKEIANVMPLRTKNKINQHLSKSDKQIIKQQNNTLPYNWKRNIKNSRFDHIIDLHGKTLEEAFDYIQIVIEQCYLHQKRTLLIITGKGTLKNPSILKQKIPHWLENSTLAKYILDIKPAARKDGGNGAIYVILKKCG